MPFSLEKEELITYESVEEDADKPIQEILNTEEFAFSADEDCIIENGIFKGKRLIEEESIEIDYTSFIKKYRPLNYIKKAFIATPVWIGLATLILAKAEVLSYITAILIPVAVFVVGIILGYIDNFLIRVDIRKDAHLYKATVLKADVLSKSKYVVYAYEDEEGVKLIEPMDIASNLSQKDWEDQYNRPINVWIDINKFPYCIEEDVNDADTNKKTIITIALYITVVAIIVVAAVFFQLMFNRTHI